MKVVTTLSRNYGHRQRVDWFSTSPRWVELTDATIIAWIFACWACAVKVDLTDTTNIIVGDVPTPSRDTVPSLYFDLHDVSFLMRTSVVSENALSSLEKHQELASRVGFSC